MRHGDDSSQRCQLDVLKQIKSEIKFWRFLLPLSHKNMAKKIV